MLNTILCKRTALPLGLLSLALVLPSCGSSEYKKYADNQAKQVASILRENGCKHLAQLIEGYSTRVFHFIFP